MSLSDTVQQVKSGVFHIVALRDGTRVASGSAFATCGYLVTNFHVANVPAAVEVWVRRDGDSEAEGLRIKGQRFRRSIVTSSDENNYDYAILNLPEVVHREGTHSFNLHAPDGYRVGDQVAFLGFPYEHQNITCHAGIVSSFYRKGPADIIQLDASVNPSNSGGPLLNIETGEAIGIVTRRATGLTRAFAHLRGIVENNISLLSTPDQPDMVMGGLSLRQTIAASQNQMLMTLGEIERQANVGIGYAFSTRHLMDENVIYEVLHPKAPSPP